MLGTFITNDLPRTKPSSVLMAHAATIPFNLKLTAPATALLEQSFKFSGRVSCGRLLAPVWNSAAVGFLSGNSTKEELKEGGGEVPPDKSEATRAKD